ncbi:MAG TPA: M20 family metallopeptidase [Planctomycetota bacterium]|nr:M20 family metallopeptidase [Planctomycetota bacterium]
MAAEDMKHYFDSRREELVKLTAELVAARTVNPPGDEWRAVEVIERYLGPPGIPCSRHEKEKGRTNLVVRIGTGPPALVIVGHIDTVPAGDGWETDPFTVVERDGKLYGRGTSDDKGGTASMLLAGRYLKEHESELGGEVVLVAAADEERGSKCGMQFLLDEGIVDGDFAIIPDAASEMKTVFIAEKAALFTEITSHGRQAHGSTPEKGINAITNLMEVLRRIDRMRFDVIDHELLTPPTWNLGMIQGGVAPNVVPATCTAALDMRYLPGDSADTILGRVEAICRDVEKEIPGARFELKVTMADTPIEVPRDHPLVTAIVEETQAALGFTPGIGGMSGSTVAKFCVMNDITAVNFAPGESALAHMANECVRIDSLVDFAYVLARIVLRLLK